MEKDPASKEVIEGDRRQDIDVESQLSQVIYRNQLYVQNFFSILRINISCSKIENDIENEDYIDKGVEGFDPGRVELVGVEGDRDRNRDGLIDSQHDNHQIPPQSIHSLGLNHISRH